MIKKFLDILLHRQPPPPAKPDPRVCSKANARTWLNPRIKLQLEEYRFSHNGPWVPRWKILVWSHGEWQMAAWGQNDTEDAFAHMKEINAHQITSRNNPEGIYWDISCRKQRKKAR